MLRRERRSCLHKERIPGTGVVFGLVPGFLGTVIALRGLRKMPEVGAARGFFRRLALAPALGGGY